MRGLYFKFVNNIIKRFIAFQSRKRIEIIYEYKESRSVLYMNYVQYFRLFTIKWLL